jgi:hypothetical protein
MAGQQIFIYVVARPIFDPKAPLVIHRAVATETPKKITLPDYKDQYFDRITLHPERTCRTPEAAIEAATKHLEAQAAHLATKLAAVRADLAAIRSETVQPDWVAES